MKRKKGIARTLISSLSAVLSIALLIPAVAFAQATGGIRGTVADQTGAVISKATVTVKHLGTNIERVIVTGESGIYSADNLAPGNYEVKVEADGFQRQLTAVTVLTGNTSSVDFSLPAGAASETVSVTAEAPQINKSEYKIDGVITRERVENLPLNGRNFLELAQLEPGVTVRTVANPGALANSFTQVQIAGVSGALTRISVDGANVNDRVTGGSATNFSQETVQEFQISTFNFDLSTSVTGVGSINIVSRGGTNELHGSAFFFFRDHNMSAYPNLRRSATLPDPFFARRQSGFSVGGPVKKDRTFWFTNYEYNNQTSISEIAFNRTVGDGGAFADTFNHTGLGPLRSGLFNAKIDHRLNDKHNGFFRYSEEHNEFTGFNTNNESTWNLGDNNAYNAVLGVTSVLNSRLVNDFRANYNFLASALAPPDSETCGDSIGCLGAAGPFITVLGPGFNIGTTSGLPTDRANRTYQITDNLSWQKGTHRIRFGGEFEKYVRFGSTATNDTGLVSVFGPDLVRSLSPARYAALPANLRVDPVTLQRVSTAPVTLADIFTLPVATFQIGVGDYSSPAPFNREEARRTNRYRLFFQDGWQMRQNFTLTYGLSWVYESNLRNYDLPKPKYLEPVLGGGENLLPAPHEYKNFSPVLGFAWTVDKEQKTVIRGGGGLYFDSDIGASRIGERRILGPSGNGRVVVAGTAIANPLFGAPGFTGQPQVLNSAVPSGLTVGQIISILPAIKAAQEARFGRLGDLSLQNVQVLKSATQAIFSRDTRTPYVMHVTAGIQRQLMKNMSLTADFIMRRGVAFGGPHTIFDVDLNHFNKPSENQVVDPVSQAVTYVRDPVIPNCTVPGATTAQTLARINDPNVLCSAGPINIFQSASNTRYVALHVKLDKRFSNNFQFTASYALSRYNTWNGIINLNDWQASYGINDADRPHRLNFSGIWELPGYKGDSKLMRGALNGWQLSTITQFQSAPPLNVVLDPTALDLDGDGTSFAALPGLDWNSFGRGMSPNDVRAAVAAWNARVISLSKPIAPGATAAQRAACTLRHPLLGNTDPATTAAVCGFRTQQNQVLPLITLPENFDNGDTLLSTDMRLTRIIKLNERLRLSLIAEGFNIFNVSNLGGYTGNLRSADFGQPTTRLNQVFGTGGPRAFQFAAKVNF